MAIGTPTIVGSIGVASATSLAISSTTGAIATHDLVIVGHYAASATASIATLADDSSNSYVKLYQSSTSTAPILEIYAVFDAIAMTTTHAISATFNAGAARHGLYAINVTGMLRTLGVFDPHTGTRESTTGTGGTSLPFNNAAAVQTLLIGWTVAGATLGTYTPNGSLTALTALTVNAFMYPTYQILSNGAATNLAPSWVNSVLHTTVGHSYVGTPATNTSRQAQMSLVGVGA